MQDMIGPIRVGVVLVGLVFLGCGESPPGRSLYTDSGCARCHASDLSGTRLGPPLRGMAEHWDEAGLVAFLEAPDRIRVEDDRLRAVAERYPAPMPVFIMSDSARSTLATYLLSAPE